MDLKKLLKQKTMQKIASGKKVQNLTTKNSYLTLIRSLLRTPARELYLYTCFELFPKLYCTVL